MRILVADVQASETRWNNNECHRGSSFFLASFDITREHTNFQSWQILSGSMPCWKSLLFSCNGSVYRTEPLFSLQHWRLTCLSPSHATNYYLIKGELYWWRVQRERTQRRSFCLLSDAHSWNIRSTRQIVLCICDANVIYSIYINHR